ncbi:MAG TPA: deoxynucleoside kinase [Mycobacteriales bacterium]
MGFEGIVASGKTTQSRLLAESIRSAKPELVPEFGNHELGRYLSEFGSPGMRLTPEGCDTSYVRHLFALASHVQKLDEARRSTAKSVVLLDVATLTDMAYALADLPSELGADLRARMMSAVGSLIERVQPSTDNGILIYLDCDPKVAALRLAERSGIHDDSERVEFLIRMHKAYDDLLDGRKDVRRVDANRTRDEVAESVRELVGHLFR